jgi:hypothetical protein
MSGPDNNRRRGWLTPQEARNLKWVIALFALGVAVKWLRQNGYL